MTVRNFNISVLIDLSSILDAVSGGENPIRSDESPRAALVDLDQESALELVRRRRIGDWSGQKNNRQDEPHP